MLGQRYDLEWNSVERVPHGVRRCVVVEIASDALHAYYARGEEADRLGRGVGRLEFLRTIEIVQRTLPDPPAVVADIGGGPGRYTDWLVGHGYEVVHRDLVAAHVHAVASRHPDVDTQVGDARDLDLADGSVDVVLLLGPIYHLHDPDDRVRALREARRIVRPTGVVHIAAISRWAARLDGMLVQRLHETRPALASIVDEGERTGWIRPAHEGGFTCATHRPDELRSEIEHADLLLEALVSVEGLNFALGDLDERLDDPDQRELVLDTLRRLESVPELLGVGPHLLAEARPSTP
jgi:SAM-dependent methyltransferase